MRPVRALWFGTLIARPPDVRFSWTSTDAQQEWEPRFSRIREALLQAELLMLAEGNTTAALTECAYADLGKLLDSIAGAGLIGIPLSARLLPSHLIPYRQNAPVEEYMSHILLVCRRGRAAEVAAAIGAERPQYEIAGVPACCAGAVSPGGGTRQFAAASEHEFEGNAFLAAAGLSAVRHIACSPQCKETTALARRRIATARRLGKMEEMGWLEEILRLPGRASEVNGIVETITPLFRMVASGIDESKNAHQEPNPVGPNAARTHPSARRQRAPAEKAADTGLLCEHWVRRGRLALIASEQVSAIRAAVGSALDLPCGNGLLLEFVRLENNRLECNGLDPDASAVAAARDLHSAHAARFEVGAYSAEALIALSVAIAPVGIIFFSLDSLRCLAGSDRLALLKQMESMSPILVAYSLEEMPPFTGLSEALLASLGLAPHSATARGAASARVRLLSS